MSFIRQAKLYKELGCKNNKFLLALHDRDLMNIDPHNLTDPSIELRLRVAAEAKRNIWYVLRELIRVPSAGGDGYVNYIANRYNIALTWVTFNDIDSYSTILRQVGKTTGLLGNDAAIMYLMETNYHMGWISKDSSAVQEAVNRMKSIRDSFPEYLIANSFKDTDNKEGIDYKAMKNSFRTFVAQKSPIQAKKASRGLSMPRQTYDEFAYIDNNKIIFSSAAAATTKARAQVLATGGIAPICIATTAADPTSPSGKYAYEMMKDCMRFQEKLFDCRDKEELMEYLTKGSIRKMFYIHYNHLQLGYTNQWLEDVLIHVGCDEDEADWDFRSIWKVRGTRGAIDKDVMKIIRDNQRDPLFTDMHDGMLFNYFVPVEKLYDPAFINKPLILGNDSSENIEKDFCTLFAIDPLDMTPVMSFRCNKSNLNAVARNIFNILIRFPRMVWIPERNHVGAMIIDTVLELLCQIGENPIFRIYNQFIDEAKDIRELNPRQLLVDGFTGSSKGKFGFRTTGGLKGRSALYNTTFKKMLDLNKTRIYDATLIEQLGELEIRNGRVDHPAGKHDDMVIAYLLACFFVFFGKNLDHYGIKPHELINLNVVVSSSKDNNEGDEILTQFDYEAILRKIKELEYKVEVAPSGIVKSALEMQLTNYKEFLQNYDVVEQVVTKQHMMGSHAERHGMSDAQRTSLANLFVRTV